MSLCLVSRGVQCDMYWHPPLTTTSTPISISLSPSPLSPDDRFRVTRLVGFPLLFATVALAISDFIIINNQDDGTQNTKQTRDTTRQLHVGHGWRRQRYCTGADTATTSVSLSLPLFFQLPCLMVRSVLP